MNKSICGRTRETLKESLIRLKMMAPDPEITPKDFADLKLIQQKSTKIRQLIREFDDFYEKWMEKLKDTIGVEEENANFERASKERWLTLNGYV